MINDGPATLEGAFLSLFLCNQWLMGNVAPRECVKSIDEEKRRSELLWRLVKENRHFTLTATLFTKTRRYLAIIGSQEFQNSANH